ncbi:probable glucitol transport protein GutA [Anaerobium acetethylicum]|uniref:Probable glucitol transport protein GutA n=2 Tax=Anaerobium acetethylicum TaxID=1619234 RepID=A0A1D3TNE5_9FIRM|nr:probable glucitol transport protein GutA [Anaerobium acetethylicum]
MGKREKNPDRIGAGKFFAWQSRSLSSACNIVIQGFLGIYFTDQLGLSPALVATLMMFGNIVDAVTDLLAGYVVDRTNTKLGKGRPYELCIIGVWLCTWLLYSCPPNFSMTLKYAWVFIMSLLVRAIFNTILNSAQMPYMVRAFSKGQLVRIASYGGLLTMVGSIIVSISFPILMGTLATSAKGWSTLLAIYAIPLGVIGIMRFFLVKEDIKVEESTTEKVAIHSIFKVLGKNPFIWMVALAQMLQGTVLSMGVGTYFYKYVVGNIGIMGMIMAVSVVVLPVMFFVPPLLKRMPKGRLIVWGTALQIIGALVMFAAGASIPMIIVAAIIGGIGVMPITFLVDLQILDCCSYSEWKGLPRLEGSLGSFRNFVNKCGNGLGGLLFGVMLEASGYVGTAATQPDSAIMTIRLAIGVVPAIMYLIVGVLMLAYGRLDKLMPQIERDNAAKAVSLAGGNE